ncbi:unnamed protein product, partial [Ectocarpus fasciculatus]
APTAGSASGCQKLIIPGYFYPALWKSDTEWNVVAGLPNEGIIIMNPNSGPGASVSSDYTAAIGSAKAAGFTVIAYVHTSYGARSAADVKRDVDTYESFYGIDGIFFDEASSSGDDIPYYTNISNYVYDVNSSYIVMLNFGTTPDERYMAVADIAMSFEQTFEHYNESYNAPSYVDKYPASKFAHLIHTTSVLNWRTALDMSFERNAGYVYITDDVMPNPWDTLPSYVTTQSILASENC